jgi:hypothetical protein
MRNECALHMLPFISKLSQQHIAALFCKPFGYMLLVSLAC